MKKFDSYDRESVSAIIGYGAFGILFGAIALAGISFIIWWNILVAVVLKDPVGYGFSFFSLATFPIGLVFGNMFGTCVEEIQDYGRDLGLGAKLKEREKNE